MEFEAPFPPTPQHRRLEALRAFIDGEACCDAGDFVGGMALMKQANRLAWELDAVEWPAWANALYDQLQNGAAPPEPPPILAAEDNTAAQRFIAPELHALRAASTASRWWDTPSGTAAVAASLAKQHFCVLDGFAGSTVASRLRGACDARWAQQDAPERFFHPAPVTTPGGGTSGTRSALTRSDYIAWADPTSDAAPDGLQDAVGCVDALVRALQPVLLPPHAPPVRRQRPQLARYDVGDAFARHCDNYCPASRSGPHCNPRWLTAVYYTTDGWKEPDGGCLRIFHPQGGEDGSGSEPYRAPAAAPALSAATAAAAPVGAPVDVSGARGGGDANEPAGTAEAAEVATEDGALVDVAPLADRLLIFHSDFRVPHAVLPVGEGAPPRYACTVWINHGDRDRI